MKTFANIRRAAKMLRRNDGAVFEFSLESLLQWADHLHDIDAVLGRMSRSDFRSFVVCEGDDYAKTLIKTLPTEWSATKSAQDKWRSDLRLADKFLNTCY